MSTTELTKEEVKAAARAQGKCDACQWNSASDTCVLTGACRHAPTIRQEAPPTPRALAIQVGGGHYKDMPIQPFEYIHANSLGFAEGCAIKYLSRWRAKGGIEDLRKARHFIDLLIDAEVAKPFTNS